MICCTVCTCISSPHYGSSCDWKGSSCLRIFSDTFHKIFGLTSSILKSALSWWSLMTVINLTGTNLINIVLVARTTFPFYKHVSESVLFFFLVDGSKFQIQYFDFKFVVEDGILLIFIWPKLISFCPIHGTGVAKVDESNFIILNCRWKCS